MLDLLADIGGLSDMLYEVGSILVAFISFFTGSGLNRLLISRVFKVDSDPSIMYKSSTVENSLDLIAKRTPFPVKVCKLFC